MIHFTFFAAVAAQWIPDSPPAIGVNFTCPFSVLSWNCLEVHSPAPGVPAPSENAAFCASLRYIPPEEPAFFRIDPVAFIRLFNGSTIWFDGDSVTTQSYVEFSCRFSPFLLGSPTLRRSPVQHECNQWNLCHNNTKNGPITAGDASFVAGKNRIRIVGFGRTYNLAGSILNNLSFVQRGDAVVVNQGHHGPEMTHIDFLRPMLPSIKAAQQRGVIIIWRETTASHFLTDAKDAAYNEHVRVSQPGFGAVCADATFQDHERSWIASKNKLVNAFLEENGVPILRIWEATFQAPAVCHVGGGRDCVHFCIPGVVGYIVDALLFMLFKQKPVS
jgi:hypothetical protein